MKWMIFPSCGRVIASGFIHDVSIPNIGWMTAKHIPGLVNLPKTMEHHNFYSWVNNL